METFDCGRRGGGTVPIPARQRYRSALFLHARASRCIEVEDEPLVMWGRLLYPVGAEHCVA